MKSVCPVDLAREAIEFSEAEARAGRSADIARAVMHVQARRQNGGQDDLKDPANLARAVADFQEAQHSIGRPISYLAAFAEFSANRGTGNRIDFHDPTAILSAARAMQSTYATNGSPLSFESAVSMVMSGANPLDSPAQAFKARHEEFIAALARLDSKVAVFAEAAHNGFVTIVTNR